MVLTVGPPPDPAFRANLLLPQATMLAVLPTFREAIFSDEITRSDIVRLDVYADAMPLFFLE